VCVYHAAESLKGLAKELDLHPGIKREVMEGKETVKVI
jgi:hypothetical protein